jgi:hypothetical protein
MSAPFPAAGEQVVLPGPPVTLAGIEEMIERQRSALLLQTHDMLAQAVDRVVTEHGTPLADQLRASLVQTLEDVQRRQMEPFFDKTREMILASIDEVTQKHLRPLAEQLRQTLLQTAEELQKRQLDPLLEQTRKFLLGVADELRDKYTKPLADQVKKAMLETVDEMRQKHAEPFLGVAREMLDRLNVTLREQLLVSLRVTLLDPLQDILNKRFPPMMQGAGARALDIVIAGTLFCVAAVLVSVGIVLGLQRLGVPDWITFLGVGLAALLVGLIFYRKRAAFWQQMMAPAPKPAGRG